MKRRDLLKFAPAAMAAAAIPVAVKAAEPIDQEPEFKMKKLAEFDSEVIGMEQWGNGIIVLTKNECHYITETDSVFPDLNFCKITTT